METETGNITLRNNRHLKHQVKKHIKFADGEESAEEEESDTDEGLATKQVKSKNRFGPIRVSARLAEAALRQGLETA